MYLSTFIPIFVKNYSMESTDLVKLIQTGKKHQDYARTVQLAADYRAWVTGEGLNDMLQRIVKREDEDSFKQRLALTAHIIPTAVSKARSVFFEGLRNNSISLNFTSETKGNVEALQSLLSEFYGMKDERAYLDSRIVDKSFIDPNAWVICETVGTDGKDYARSYPFEVSSDQAWDFGTTNGTLDYLFICIPNKYSTKDGEKTGRRYTLYTNERAIIADQTDFDPLKTLVRKPFEIVETEFGSYFIDDKDNCFVIIEPLPYNLTAPIAMRWGYKLDALTDHRTFISELEAARPYFKKSLKAVSEMDLSSTLHAFPQKIEYAPRCTATGCNSGLMLDGKQCPACHGSGFQVSHTSAQDIIRLALPREAESAFSLTNLVAYVTLPIDVLEFQKQYVKDLTDDIMKAIFNSDTYTRAQITETATQQIIDKNSVNNSLYYFAKQYSELWQYIVWQTAEYASLDDSLTLHVHVNEDFKLRTLDELINELKQAKDAGANQSILIGMQNDIAAIQYKDNKDAYQKYKVMTMFDPFFGKTEQERLGISSTLPLDNDTRVLYMFFGEIFNNIDIEKGVVFYYMNPAEQKRIIDEYVASYKSELTVTPPRFE